MVPTPPYPLSNSVRCYALAAHLGPATDDLKSRLLGDGLVPMSSALGQKPRPVKLCTSRPEHQAVVAETGHLELLASEGWRGGGGVVWSTQGTSAK